MQKTILEMKNIEKSFSGVKVLKGVNFNLKSGEIHALMGENGAGKSTLMKILTGVYKADSGKIFYLNKEQSFSSVKESNSLGINIIHQELNQVLDLTVSQNMFLGREINRFGFLIDDKKINSETEKILSFVGVKIPAFKKVKELTVGNQQMLEIAKALSFDSKILVFDEPTTALTEVEANELFKIMKGLKEKGIGMIYISHRMDEIEKIADRITVMRDGETVGTFESGSVTKNEIVSKMVGKEIELERPVKQTVTENSAVLEVKNLSSKDGFENISFKLYKGEVLGIAGLMGAGRTELARAIFGADRIASGEIFLYGKRVEFKMPADAVKKGFCYLSEDRKRYGLLLYKNVKDNTVLSSLKSFVRFGFINEKKATRKAEEKNRLLKTKITSTEQLVKNLSGGNQQKVIFARWLLKDSDVFILDEPTKGIDVGAKQEIYKLIENLVADGKSIILISSEFSEIEYCAERVIVMCEGKITKILKGNEINKENILKYAMMRESVKNESS